MKKTLVAALIVIGLASCSKQNGVIPTTNNTTATQAKKTNPTLSITYTLDIKKPKTEKENGSIQLKIKEIIINGDKLTGNQMKAIFGVVLAINNTKKEQNTPDVLLKPTQFTGIGNSSVYTASIASDNPLFQSYVGAQDNVLARLAININGSAINTKELKDMKYENSSITISGGNVIFTNDAQMTITNGSDITIKD